MRMKVRMPKTSYCELCPVHTRYITVTACEYELMNFLGICLFIKEKTNSKKSIYK